jgi:hypothetical protein
MERIASIKAEEGLGIWLRGSHKEYREVRKESWLSKEPPFHYILTTFSTLGLLFCL